MGVALSSCWRLRAVVKGPRLLSKWLFSSSNAVIAWGVYVLSPYFASFKPQNSSWPLCNQVQQTLKPSGCGLEKTSRSSWKLIWLLLQKSNKQRFSWEHFVVCSRWETLSYKSRESNSTLQVVFAERNMDAGSFGIPLRPDGLHSSVDNGDWRPPCTQWRW